MDDMHYTLIYDDHNDGELYALAVSSKYTGEDIQEFIDKARREHEDYSRLDIIGTFPNEIGIIFEGNIPSAFI